MNERRPVETINEIPERGNKRGSAKRSGEAPRVNECAVLWYKYRLFCFFVVVLAWVHIGGYYDTPLCGHWSLVKINSFLFKRVDKLLLSEYNRSILKKGVKI